MLGGLSQVWAQVGSSRGCWPPDLFMLSGQRVIVRERERARRQRIRAQRRHHLLRAPGFGFRASGFEFRVSGFGFPASADSCRALALSARCDVRVGCGVFVGFVRCVGCLGVGFVVRGVGGVWDIGFEVWVSGFGIWGFGFGVWDLGSCM